jgi:hypothetical protein
MLSTLRFSCAVLQSCKLLLLLLLLLNVLRIGSEVKMSLLMFSTARVLVA